jgi:DNA helicase-2/ATP-dependent DNA helicase PcrA
MKSLLDDLNSGQQEAAESTEGRVLIIAGPGSGKTLTLVRRTMNILEKNLAKPEEIVLCTFTEKAALELRDRVRTTASDIDYLGDMSSLRVGTLHGIANEFVEEFRHRTPLGNNFEVLDDLTQKLFIFDKFNEIVPEPIGSKYFGKWSTKWSTIKELLPYFDKITEELIDPEILAASEDPFLSQLGIAYREFERLLWESNKVDFAHLQKIFVNLLRDPEVGPTVIARVKYVMVDEYQDTNHIQELIVDLLSSGTGNLCVVGDEDQALYRFRGATVRNILELGKGRI